MDREFERQLCARQRTNIQVISCAIERVKYRPQRNCLVGYKLTLRDGNAEFEQRLYLGTFAAEEARARYEKSLAEARVDTALFAPVTLLSSFNAVVWAFPNDRTLTSLVNFDNAALLRESMLRDVVAAHWGKDWEIAGVSQRISNYFPEHSCCVNVKVSMRHLENNDRRDWEIIGKMRYDDAGAESHDVMNALCRIKHTDVACARSLAYQPTQRVHWQARVPGVTLNSLLAAGSADSTILQRVGRAVAALHSTPVMTPRRFSVDNLVANLAHAKNVITASRPDCSIAVRRVIEFLLDRADRLDSNAGVACHGDLHSNNILVSPSQIYLVDMDRVTNGPPLADLGSFLAELAYRACAKNQALHVVQAKLNAVIVAYRERASWPVIDDDIAWHTASALIHERALRCITSLKPGRAELLENIIATAERIAKNGLISESFETSGRAA